MCENIPSLSYTYYFYKKCTSTIMQNIMQKFNKVFIIWINIFYFLILFRTWIYKIHVVSLLLRSRYFLYADLVKSVRFYFSIFYAPWDFRYARMRNADLLARCNELHSRRFLSDATYANINALRQAGSELQVAIQCPSSRGRSSFLQRETNGGRCTRARRGKGEPAWTRERRQILKKRKRESEREARDR